jgi:hypothetical protein
MVGDERVELAPAARDRLGERGVAGGGEGGALRIRKLDTAEVGEVVAISLGAEEVLRAGAEALEEGVVPDRLVEDGGGELAAARET